MSRQAVVESNEILLEDTTDSSSSEEATDLTRTLANTRVVAQDTTYTVEEVTTTDLKKIKSFYFNRSDGTTRRVKQVKETDDLFAPSNGGDTDLNLSEITLGKLTPEHLSQYPNGEEVRDVTPIEPISYTPTGGSEHTLYFAEIETEYVVTLQLRNDVGERQTVYKTFDSETSAEKFTAQIAPTVSLILDANTIKIKNNVEDDTEDSTDSSTATASKLEIAKPIFMGLGVWGVPSIVALLVYSFTQINPFILGISSVPIWLLGIAIATGKADSIIGTSDDTTGTANNNESQFSNSSNKPSFYESSKPNLKQNILLHEPYDAESENTEQEPVTSVTVETRFTGDVLELTIEDIDESLYWKYETTESDVFEDSEIVDFYTELGFDESENTKFTAFASTEKYDQLPRLEDSRTNNSVYLYPEDPRN